MDIRLTHSVAALPQSLRRTSAIAERYKKFGPLRGRDGLLVREEDELVGELSSYIAKSYDYSPFRLGWRLLYGPTRALTISPELMFVGLNPGGSVPEPPIISVEEGNAFRIEQWQNKANLSILQRQAIELFKRVAMELGRDWKELMDSTPTLNFCPFRSPSWAALPDKGLALAVSFKLWHKILAVVHPSVIVCNGVQTGGMMIRALEESGYEQCESKRGEVGWGAVLYSSTWLRRGSDAIQLFSLPHLSRYPFIGRFSSETCVREIINDIADGIAHAGEAK